MLSCEDKLKVAVGAALGVVLLSYIVLYVWLLVRGIATRGSYGKAAIR